MNVIAVTLLALSLVGKASSEVVMYKDHVIYPERPEFLIVPKYAKNDIPSWSPGNGKSYIDLSRLNVKTTCKPDGSNSIPSSAGDSNVCVDSTFEMLMFKAPTDRPWTDYWELEEFCCNNKLLNAQK